VVHIPHEVTGAVVVTGGAVGSVGVNHDGSRVVSVAPSGGTFAITIAPAPLALTACA
jgi:hypothetical protein